MFRHDIIGENLLCNRTLYVRVYAYFEMLGMQYNSYSCNTYIKNMHKSPRKQINIMLPVATENNFRLVMA